MLRNLSTRAAAGKPSAAPFVSGLLDQLPNAVIVFLGASKDLIYANPAAEVALD
jgi:hypothetical protein